MEQIIRSKNKHRLSGSKIFWLIVGIINTVGIFLVVRWYSQFTNNQRSFVNIDESTLKISANALSEGRTISQSQRRLLETSLSQQTVEEFLSLSLLNNPKFQSLRRNYTPLEISSTTVTTTDEDLSGLKIGNPHPFNY